MIAKSHKLCLRRYHEAKLASSAAVVLAHLDGVDEAASMSARAIRCQPGDCREPDKQTSGNGSMEERTGLSEPGQREGATSSDCPSGVVCSTAAVGAGLQGDCSTWLSSEISGRDVLGSSGMTAVE